MATLQQIQSVLVGFPRDLNWGNFTPVQASRLPPHQAQSASTWSMSGWRAALDKGAYRVHGLRINVTVNAGASWVVNTARTGANSPALLRHEQGHYDITGLVARDLASSVIDLSLDADVVAAMNGSGRTAAEHLHFVQRGFQRDVDEFGRQARDLLARLQTNPASGATGLYDRQTQHGTNLALQTSWNTRFATLKRTTNNFRLALSIEGVL
jgi:hypothetical protein